MLSAEIDTTTGAIVGLRHLGRDLALVTGPSGEPPFRLDLVGSGPVTEVRETIVEAVADGIRTTWRLAGGITVTGDVRPRGEDLLFTAWAEGEGSATIERLTY